MKKPLQNLSAFLAIALALPAANRVCAGDTPIVSDDFQSGKQYWLWHGDVEGGEFRLTASDDKQYSGSQALLKQPLQLGTSDKEALHIHFKINALDAAGGRAEARFFLVPEPLKSPTFADPSSERSALTVLVAADASKSTLSVTLFQKAESAEPGYGTALYKATLSADQLPVSMDWFLTAKEYALKFEPAAQTVDGSKIGSWDPGSVLGGDLRYVMRVVNVKEGSQSVLKISDFAVSTSPMPE